MYNLKTKETAWFKLFELTPDLVIIANKDGFFKQVNPAVITKLGYTKKELFDNPISYFIHPDDKERTARKRKELINGKALINFENRYLTKKGEIIWLHWTSVYIKEQEVVFAIAKDVTLRKQAEMEIVENYRKFKNLAIHFKMDMEKDKKYLAVELHEELAQLASVVKMDINWLNDQDKHKDATIQKRLDNALSTTQQLINSIRKISYSLSSNMVDDLGLNETLQWLCEEFTQQHNIPCYFESIIDDETIEYEIKLDLFRICQEALNNIILDESVNTVNIKLENSGQKINLSITDDGAGLDLEELNELPGLSAIRKRVSSVEGELIVESSVGNGKRICVII